MQEELIPGHARVDSRLRLLDSEFDAAVQIFLMDFLIKFMYFGYICTNPAPFGSFSGADPGESARKMGSIKGRNLGCAFRYCVGENLL